MTTLEVLRKARGLIEGGWLQRGMEEGNQYCALGALNKAHHGSACHKYGTLGERLDYLALLEATGAAHENLGRWNDADGRTHAEVLAAFDRAIEAEEAKRSPETVPQATPRRRDDVGCEVLGRAGAAQATEDR